MVNAPDRIVLVNQINSTGAITESDVSTANQLTINFTTSNLVKGKGRLVLINPSNGE